MFKTKTLLLLSLLVLPGSALAAQPQYRADGTGGWVANIGSYANIPDKVIVVDKNAQKVLAFEQKKKLSKIAAYPCTTGKNSGDKLVRGDLKTPEGVYFVTGHITSGLDYKLYGKEAYPLNYPNPVDKYRKKTGSGIWVHGKGIPLVRQDTQGCVGMNIGDMRTLGSGISMGQPVAMAEKVLESAHLPVNKADIVAKLDKNVRDWAKAWSNRSSAMFDYYDPEGYSIAQRQSFSSFRQNKEKLFKRLPWIDTQIHDLQIMEGPGYWVTWFNQTYKAPNLMTRGTRRLYWMPDKNGELKIMGMEWINGLKSPTLLADAQNAQRYAESSVSDKGKAPVATGSANAGGTYVAANTVTPSGNSITASAKARQPEATTKAEQAKAATNTAPVTGQQTAQPVQAAEQGTMQLRVAKAEQAKKVALQKQSAEVFLEKWRSAWENANVNGYQACYAENAVQDKRSGATNIMLQKQQLWQTSKPQSVQFERVKFTPQGNLMQVDMRQIYRAESGYADRGSKRLLLKPHGSSWLIIREAWSK